MPGVGPRSDEYRDLIAVRLGLSLRRRQPLHAERRGTGRRGRHRRLEGLSKGRADSRPWSDDVFHTARGVQTYRKRRRDHAETRAGRRSRRIAREGRSKYIS